MLFESLLANNVKFGSLNEIITFIDNIHLEHRNYNDCDVLDRDITLEETFIKIIETTGYNWIPTKEDANIIWQILTRLSQEDLNRIYYKNNMYEFCNNSLISNILINILCKLKMPFLDPNNPPDEIKDDLELLVDYIKEYVYYQYQIIDKLERIEIMPRDVVLITDTDSCIISLEEWYQFILEKTKNIDMNIKHELIDVLEYFKKDEFGDREKNSVVERIDYKYEYDFYNQKMVQKQRMINPIQVIPQDGLRHSIINIMAYCISKCILDYMYKYTINYQSQADNRKCLLKMKNEFLFKSILLTKGKKNYASIQEVQEGNIVPKEASLAISGLPISKAGTPKSTARQLEKILYEDILNSDNIDQLGVLNSLAIIERNIFDSIQNGETKYYKPVRIKPASSYDDPMRIQGVKAAEAYNRLKNEVEEPIDLTTRNELLIIKTDITKAKLEELKLKNEELYNKMNSLLNSSNFKGELTSIAIPFNAKIPKWILDFVDYTKIVNDNISNFPIDSIGISTLNNTNVPYSNILKL